MADESASTSSNDYLSVEIKAGPAFRPPPRLAAALEELRAAIEEASDPEVAGYVISPRDPAWGLPTGELFDVGGASASPAAETT